MEATEYLTHQHRQIEEALREALAQDNPDIKRSRFLDIADALILHIAAEEQVFYPAVHRDRNEDVLLESLEEHLALKRLLSDLLSLHGDDVTFQPKLHVLREQAEHHHRDEEKKLFPQVREKMDAAAREELGREMEALETHMQARGKPRKAVHEQTDAAEPLR
jgi:hemerythrin superfamily protein